MPHLEFDADVITDLDGIYFSVRMQFLAGSRIASTLFLNSRTNKAIWPLGYV